MNTIYIDTSEIHSHKDAYKILQEEQLKEGDEIHIFTKNDHVALVLVTSILLAILYYFQSDQHFGRSYGQQLLDDLFGEKSTDQIEKEIEDEYGITIEVEQKDSFKDDWNRFAAKGLADSYGEEEPDYSNAELKERNTDYQGPAEI